VPWKLEYERKLCTAEEALGCVHSGMRVYIQPGSAEPETLVEALIRRAPFVHDVEIVHILTLGTAPYVAPKMEGRFRHNAMRHTGCGAAIPYGSQGSRR
jgi:4-hydroxybutyrate CoA-transferase